MESLFYGVILYVIYCFTVILLRKRELIALLHCVFAGVAVGILCVFHTVLWVGLLCVFASFPDHTHLLLQVKIF